MAIIFSDRRRKPDFQQPSLLPTSIEWKISTSLASLYDRTVCQCVDTSATSLHRVGSVHALRILRARGITAGSIHMIFKAGCRRRQARLRHQTRAWWSFTTADDRQRLEAVIRHGIRSGLRESNHKTADELIDSADDKLFSDILYNKQHNLDSLLQGTTETNSDRQTDKPTDRQTTLLGL